MFMEKMVGWGGGGEVDSKDARRMQITWVP